MMINSPDEPPAVAQREGPDDGPGAAVSTLALVAVVVGSLGSVGLMLYVGQRTPPFLLGMFLGWVLAPFVGLTWANMVSKRWSRLDRAMLVGLTLAVALGSVTIYGDVVLRPPKSTPARMFLLVPLGSLLLLAIVVAIATLSSRRRSRRAAVV